MHGRSVGFQPKENPAQQNLSKSFCIQDDSLRASWAIYQSCIRWVVME